MANTQNLDLVKPLGTDYALVSVLNSNSDKIDAYAGAVNASLDGLRDGLGILANGNTHAAISSGQYVYVKNHGSLPEGLYKATANIAANGTLSTTNLAADSAGGLNSLNEQIGTLNSKLTRQTIVNGTNGIYHYKYDKLNVAFFACSYGDYKAWKANQTYFPVGGSLPCTPITVQSNNIFLFGVLNGNNGDYKQSGTWIALLSDSDLISGNIVWLDG